MLFKTEFIKPKNVFSLNCEKEDNLICALNSPSYLFNYNSDIKGDDISYICSAATFNKYRNQGHMSSLLKFVLRSIYNKGHYLAVLIPSEKSLFNYYNRFAFNTFFYVSKHIFEKSVCSDNTKKMSVSVERIMAESGKLPFLYEKYNKRFSNNNFNCYKSFERFKQSVAEHSYNKEKSGFFTIGEGSAFLYFDENILVREISGIDKETLAHALIKKYNKTVIIEDIPEKNNMHELGMARILNVPAFLKWIDKKNLEFYFNIKDDIIPENNIKIGIKNGEVYEPLKSENIDIFEFSNYIFKNIGFGYMNNMLN